MTKKTEALKKPASKKQKHPEPKVTMTVIRLRREDDPVGYARFCAHVKKWVNKILEENPDLVPGLRVERAAGEEIDNRAPNV